MATVLIPTPLRKFTNNSARLETPGATVGDTIRDLAAEFPDLRKHLLDEKGQIRSFLNIFVGDEDIRDLEQENTPVRTETIISIVPAIAGGAI